MAEKRESVKEIKFPTTRPLYQVHGKSVEKFAKPKEKGPGAGTRLKSWEQPREKGLKADEGGKTNCRRRWGAKY